MTVTVRADTAAVATFAAERLTTLVDAAVAARGSAMVCLTGGRTPRRLYELRAAGDRVEWIMDAAAAAQRPAAPRA